MNTNETKALLAKTKAHIKSWLKKGPQRLKPIRDTAPPVIREKVANTLYSMHVNGEIARRVDGWHRGRPVYMFWLPDVANPAVKIQYHGYETLRAMQAHARKLLGVEQDYIDRIREQACINGEMTRNEPAEA